MTHHDEQRGGAGPDLGIPEEEAVHPGGTASRKESEDLLEDVETKGGTER